MIKPPQHPLRPAFDKARDWEAQQEKLLTDEQRRTYEDLKRKHTWKLEKDKERLDNFRKQLADRQKNQKPKPELALKPPVLTNDPYVRRQARYIINGDRRLELLKQRFDKERTDMLQKFEQEREKGDKPKQLSKAWLDALSKTATQEKTKTRDLGDDFDKSR